MSGELHICYCDHPLSPDHVDLRQVGTVIRKVVVPCKAEGCTREKCRGGFAWRDYPKTTRIHRGDIMDQKWRPANRKRSNPVLRREAVKIPLFTKTGPCPNCHEREPPTLKCTTESELANKLPLQECEGCGTQWLEGSTAGLIKPVKKAEAVLAEKQRAKAGAKKAVQA